MRGRTRSSRAEGASRFAVLFSQPLGSKRQRRWVEGHLVVGHDMACLYDSTRKTRVAVSRGSGVVPNPVFQAMRRAHDGLDWQATAGSPQMELISIMQHYVVQITEVMELHLVPYGVIPLSPTTTTGGGEAMADPCGEGAGGFLPDAGLYSPRKSCESASGLPQAPSRAKRSRSELMRELIKGYGHYYHQ
ncbi:unnamed protein product [Phytomonas sp. Hart1]|nr:unnamed protein product [Phytomonas sp. Hart1]|eukprot:CCW69701.1 unnamed protein product [Phytomonas sp. isolate Hart1]